jgi:hypothetical protein
MRCSVISLLNRSGNFFGLAGKQQGVILDEQGIWAQNVPMVAINTLAIFQEHSVHWLDDSLESLPFMVYVAGGLRRSDRVCRRRRQSPSLRFSSETVWRTYGREIAERQGEPSLG